MLRAQCMIPTCILGTLLLPSVLEHTSFPRSTSGLLGPIDIGGFAARRGDSVMSDVDCRWT